MEKDNFKGKAWKHGDSLVVTIPANIVRFGGYKPGDLLSVIIKKRR